MAATRAMPRPSHTLSVSSKANQPASTEIEGCVSSVSPMAWFAHPSFSPPWSRSSEF